MLSVYCLGFRAQGSGFRDRERVVGGVEHADVVCARGHEHHLGIVGVAFSVWGSV